MWTTGSGPKCQFDYAAEPRSRLPVDVPGRMGTVDGEPPDEHPKRPFAARRSSQSRRLNYRIACQCFLKAFSLGLHEIRESRQPRLARRPEP
jgi:hypothetical protein